MHFSQGKQTLEMQTVPCEKSRYSPVCGLVRAHAPGVCGHDSNPLYQNEGPSFRMALHFGGDGGIRTLDLTDANRTLSQLSYAPIFD